MINESDQKEGITFVNICAPNIAAPKYIKQILTDLKREIDSNTIIVGDFNTPLSSINRSFRQKINKETPALNKILHKIDLTETCRTFCSKSTEYILLKHTQNVLQDRSYVRPQTSLKKFKTEITGSIFSNHYGLKVENNYRKKTIKFKYVDIKQHATVQPISQKRNHKVPWDKQKWKYNTSKFVGCSKSSSKRDIHNNAYIKNKKDLK